MDIFLQFPLSIMTTSFFLYLEHIRNGILNGNLDTSSVTVNNFIGYLNHFYLSVFLISTLIYSLSLVFLGEVIS